MARLLIEERFDGDVLILSLHGKVTIGEGSVVLRDTIRTRLSEGVKKIVCECHDVTYLDSSGGGELVSTITTAYSNECILVFANLNKRISDYLVMAHLVTSVDVYPTVESAVDAIKDLSFSEFIRKIRSAYDRRSR